jgi:type 2 lantibiotic biosynthesis protein LanM
MRAVDRSVVQEGLRWDERLDGAVASSGTGARQTAGAEADVLQQWRRAVDPDDAGLLRRRLAWDGLDEHVAARLLTEEARAAAPAPTWWEELGSLRDACREAAGAADLGDADWLAGADRRLQTASGSARAGTVPFAHLLWPLAERSQLRLERDAGAAALVALCGAARGDGLRALLERLAEVTTRALFEEFDSEMPFGRSLMLGLSPEAGPGAPRTRYAAFCRRHLRDGLDSVLTAYPVLGRLLATVCRQWRESLHSFLDRLHADRGLLAAALDVDPGAPLCALRWSGGDRHRDGRSVIVARFGDGSSVVYKPHDMRMEARFADLTAMLSPQLEGAWAAAPRVVAVGEDHGYASFVPNDPCASHDELEHFYRNAGRLLAVLHLLGATDLHSENLVASRSALVVIDAETLFEDRVLVCGDADAPSDPARAEPLALSLLQTLMLPAWTPGDAGTFRDVSALGADPAPHTPFDAPGWRNLNSDLMAWSTRSRLPVHPVSLPVGRGESNPVGAHVDALVEGFREVCALALEADVRAQLKNAILAFSGARRRILLRHTRTYGIVQQRALAPQALRSGAARGCELDRLARAYVLGDEPTLLWPMLRAELRDLESLDVPYFEHRLGSTTLDGTGVSIPDALAGDALDRALARLEGLTPHDIAWQARLVRAALETRGSRAAAGHETGVEQPPAGSGTGDVGVGSPSEGSGGRPPAAEEPLLALDRLALQRETRRVAAEIAASALTDGAGDVTWLTPTVLPSLLPEARRVSLWLIPDGLYDGRAGVFAFLQAWAACEGSGEAPQMTEAGSMAEAAQTAEAALAPVLRALGAEEYQRFRYLRDLGLGLNGVGGLLRVFGHLAASTPDGGVWAGRRDDLAAAVDGRLVAAAAEPDLLGGVAGAVAPLAALHREQSTPQTAACLSALAARLLEAQDPRTGGWPTGQALRPLTGLSHGASGMGLALLEAGVALEDERCVAGAAAAFAYEAAVFDDDQLNWPDFRGDDDQPRFATAWCHGATGISLARMRALQLAPRHADATLWRRDLEAAAETTLRAPLGALDHLCCGNLGRAAVLRVLGEACSSPAWTAAGDALTAAVVERARREGSYRLPQVRVGRGDGLVFPGLMSGYAGIGLHLLTTTGRAGLSHLLL